MAHTDTPEIKMTDLRARAAELGVNVPFGVSKVGLSRLIKVAEAKAAAALAAPENFSDLPSTLTPAPDEELVKAAAPAPKPVVVEAPKPVVDAEPEPLPTMTALDIARAINGGDAGGLPLTKGHKATANLEGTSVELSSVQSTVNAVIGGHTVRARVEVTTRIIGWTANPRAESAGKYRLLNDVKTTMFGQLVDLKAGKEFYPHQVDMAAIESAGGQLLPLR